MNYLRWATHRVIDLITREVFSLLGTGQQVAPFSVRYPGFSLVDAYEVVARLGHMRRARGENPVTTYAAGSVEQHTPIRTSHRPEKAARHSRHP